MKNIGEQPRMSNEEALNEAERMKGLKDNPYVRTGDEKHKDMRSWTVPNEPLEKFDTEHYERASQLLDHWRDEEKKSFEKKLKCTEQALCVILDNIKSGNVVDYIHEISDIYLNFKSADNSRQNSVGQAYSGEMNHQGSTEEDGNRAAENMFKEWVDDFWKNAGYKGGENFKFFVQPEAILKGLCAAGEKKYPDYDWEEINQDVYFQENLPDEASYYLDSVVENRKLNKKESQQ
jgi:hypothetical protein